MWLMWSSKGQSHSANANDVGELDRRRSSTKGYPTRKQTLFLKPFAARGVAFPWFAGQGSATC